MSYPISLTFYTTAGLNDLRAQLFTSAGTNSGAAISTGFVERGTNGMYIWFGTIDDSFVGGVEFYSLAAASNILAIRDISPREIENNDVKASTLATPAQVAAALVSYDATVPADLADLATQASLTTVGNNVTAILDDTGTSGVIISTAVMQAIADVMLSRSFETVEDTSSLNSLAEVLMAILNSRTVGEDWIIKKSDGTTFNTRVLELDEDALPVTGTSNA